jgi:hypothetical protein
MRWFKKWVAASPEPTPPVGEWVPDLFGQKYEIEHLDGLSHYEALVPPKRHKCWAQTRGWIGGGFTRIERCPCGAVRLGGSSGYWDERNTRS